MAQQTTLKPHSCPGPLYASFAGKAAAPTVGFAGVCLSRHVCPAGRFEYWVFQWQSNDSGVATHLLDGRTFPPTVGTLIRLETVPDASNAPSANYDITLVDTIGADVLQGHGANRSDASVELEPIYHALSTADGGAISAAGDLEFRVANAGAGKRGIAVILIERQHYAAN